MDDLQGNAVVNYTEREVSYTRVIEHKHFDKNFGQPQSGKTVVSYEYPQNWRRGDEPYYPVNDEKNTALFQKYAELAKKRGDVIFGGRLGEYKYYDMDQVIGKALDVSQSELAQER
jgi:UDP-galactopyranose mutase